MTDLYNLLQKYFGNDWRNMSLCYNTVMINNEKHNYNGRDIERVYGDINEVKADIF